MKEIIGECQWLQKNNVLMLDKAVVHNYIKLLHNIVIIHEILVSNLHEKDKPSNEKIISSSIHGCLHWQVQPIKLPWCELSCYFHATFMHTSCIEETMSRWVVCSRKTEAECCVHDSRERISSMWNSNGMDGDVNDRTEDSDETKGSENGGGIDDSSAECLAWDKPL